MLRENVSHNVAVGFIALLYRVVNCAYLFRTFDIIAIVVGH